MKKIVAFIVLVQVICFGAYSQETMRWWTPDHVEGVCVRDSEHIYHRLPADMQSLVRPIVWNLSLNTAGEFIHFRTTARSLVVRYFLGNKKTALPHMPATGVSGVDLYAVDRNGNWNWAPPKYIIGDTCKYTYDHILPDGGRRLAGGGGTAGLAGFYLYLPLYNTVQSLSIGCASADTFYFVPSRKEAPIVAYGTSIMQGAVASRPGMAWTNILERNLDRTVINLGFSGNGKFEKPIFDLMAKVEAALYIFDCMPNLAGGSHATDNMVKGRIDTGIQVLRAAHPGVPILLVEHADGHMPFSMDSAVVNRYHNASLLMREAYQEIVTRGIKNIFLLTEDEIDFDISSTVEGTHPNDIGMMKYALAYERKIREILGEPVAGSGMGMRTFPAAGAVAGVGVDAGVGRPVRQFRDGFDWVARHEQVIDYIRRTNPSVLLFGNSIVNYWGGEPLPEKGPVRGDSAWRRYMAPARVQNAGFGNDRIENVLWRIYHGELDNFKGDKILLMIGTNNLAVNTDEEIISGLSFLLQQIRARKPTARIVMLGILPRKGKEDRIRLLNKEIKKMVLNGHYQFADLSSYFLTGSRINSSLFLQDGLHPNKDGYMIFGKNLQKLL